MCLRLQRLVAGNAELAGDARGIGVLAKLSRSRVNPSEHVGEQIAGGLGWSAALGSGGIWGGGTLTGKNGGAVAQADSSMASAQQSSLRRSGFESFCIKGSLNQCAGLGFAQPVALGQRRCSSGVRTLVLGSGQLGAISAVHLVAGKGQREGQGDAQRRHTPPSHQIADHSEAGVKST